MCRPVCPGHRSCHQKTWNRGEEKTKTLLQMTNDVGPACLASLRVIPRGPFSPLTLEKCHLLKTHREAPGNTSMTKSDLRVLPGSSHQATQRTPCPAVEEGSTHSTERFLRWQPLAGGAEPNSSQQSCILGMESHPVHSEGYSGMWPPWGTLEVAEVSGAMQMPALSLII